VSWLEFDDEYLVLHHDLWRWLWWEPAHTPRGISPLVGQSRAQVAWSNIASLEATGPFPEIVIQYHTKEGVHALHARPRWLSRMRGDPSEWVPRIEQLFEFARGRLPPEDLRAGWTAAEDVEWAPLEEWPDEERDVVFASPYRSGAPREEVRAIREAPASVEAMLQWLASSDDRPWREHPKRVVVTSRDVCVERRDGRRVRVSRHLLRGRRRTDSGDRAYYYGRRLRLLLPLRDDACPVVWALDADYRRYVGGD